MTIDAQLGSNHQTKYLWMFSSSRFRGGQQGGGEEAGEGTHHIQVMVVGSGEFPVPTALKTQSKPQSSPSLLLSKT